MTRSAARSSCAERPSARLALLIAALLALTLAAAMPARGADPAEGALPPNTVRIGLYALFYHVSAHDISGPYVPAGVNLNVNDVQTLYLAYVRRLWTNLDAELAFGNRVDAFDLSVFKKDDQAVVDAVEHGIGSPLFGEHANHVRRAQDAQLPAHVVKMTA